MSISSVTTYWKTPTTTSADSSGSTTGGTEIDFDAFLKLLATELQYQDPTNPVSNTEYVAQMAQMSVLQQMQTMTVSTNANSAYSIIGKTATYETTNSSGNTVTGTGTVEAVTVKNNKVYVTIDGTQVEYSAVTKVSEATASA
jgi:flagellar basal-body rod modification protein FlgD